MAWKHLAFRYTAAGDLWLIKHFANHNGSVWQNQFDTVLAYDKASRVKSITHDLATDIVHTYGHDNASRVTSFNTTGNGAAIRSYGYDNAGQLTGATGSASESYIYDYNGNRTSAMGVVSTISYMTGPANRLTGDGVHTYLYDKEGNLVEKRLGDANGFLVASYSWDHRNRLVSVTNWVAEPESRFVTYTYDAQGRRVKRTEGEVGEPAQATAEYFVYHGEDVALRFDHAQQLTHRHLYGPAVDQVLADETFETVGTERVSDEVLWQLADQQGTIRDVADDTAALRRHVDYNSVGRIMDEQGYAPDGTPAQPGFPEWVDQAFYFQGRAWDPTAWLYDFGSRPYDPLNARFLSEDPTGFDSGDPNLYRALGNSYPNYTDPTGTTQRGNPLDSLFGGSSIFAGASVPIPTSLLNQPSLFNNTSSSIPSVRTNVPQSFLQQASFSLPTFSNSATSIIQPVGSAIGLSALPAVGATPTVPTFQAANDYFFEQNSSFARNLDYRQLTSPTSAGSLRQNSNQNFALPTVHAMFQELVSGYTSEELAASIDQRIRREAAIEASTARYGSVRAITQQEADASRYLAVAGNVKHTREEQRFIEQYEAAAKGSNPYSRMLVALDVAAAFAGGYTAKGTPLSARQPIEPQYGQIKTNFGGPYSYLPDPPIVAPGKDFTRSQREIVLQENRFYNGGRLISDIGGATLSPAKQHMKGVTPPLNEANVDHISPRSKGGTNSFNNAQVISREENLRKGNR